MGQGRSGPDEGIAQPGGASASGGVWCGTCDATSHEVPSEVVRQYRHGLAGRPSHHASGHHQDNDCLSQDGASLAGSEQSGSHRSGRSIWSELGSAASHASLRSVDVQNHLDARSRRGEHAWQAHEEQKNEFLRHMQARMRPGQSTEQLALPSAADGQWETQSDARSVCSSRSQHSQRSGRSSAHSARSGRYERGIGLEPLPETGVADQFESVRGPGPQSSASQSSSFHGRSAHAAGGYGRSPRRNSLGSMRSGHGSREASRGASPEDKHRRPLDAADLEAKLRIAQRKATDAAERARSENERANTAEKELQSARTPRGGSDLELQLMQNLVGMRERCVDVEKTKRAEESKVSEIKAFLQEEQDRREEAERSLTQAELSKGELTTRIDALKQKAQQLEADVTERTKESTGLKHGLQMVSVERDETLELLERAVQQKEQMRREQGHEVGEAKTKIEQLHADQKRERGEVRRLLSNVDQLLAQLGRDQETPSEAMRELISVRDGMRQLVKTSRERPAGRPGEAERGPSALPAASGRR